MGVSELVTREVWQVEDEDYNVVSFEKERINDGESTIELENRRMLYVHHAVQLD